MIAICVLSLLASGCAGGRRISLSYHPVGQQKAAAPLGVAVMKFGDRRTDKTTGQDVDRWMTGAMAAELSQAGLQVARGAVPPGTTVTVIGNVIDVRTEMSAGVKAMVKVDIIVKKEGQVILARQYAGGSSVPASTAASINDYQKALEAALQDAMMKAVPEILAAIQ
jgi:hypothetical protein